MARAASRHGLFYDLLDAFREEGCPICRLAHRTVVRYLDVLAYENVNDPGTRGKLRAARGFCNCHAWRYVEETRDLLGTAIIYRDVLHSVIEALGTQSSPDLAQQITSLIRPSSADTCGDRGLAATLAPAGECPACRARAGSVEYYSHTLIEHLPESDFRAAYETSAGLCYPHFRRALRLVGERAGLEVLVEAEDAFLGREAAGMVGESGGWPSGQGSRVGQLRPVESGFGAPGVVPESGEDRQDPPESLVATRRPGSVESSQLLVTWTTGNPERCPACEATRPALAAAVEEFGRTLMRVSPDEAALVLGALCNRHAWQVAHAASPTALYPLLAALAGRRRTGLAAVARSVLDGEGVREGPLLPSREAKTRRLGREIARRLEARSSCSLCERQAEVELGTLTSLARSEPGPGGPILCRPHLAQSCEVSLESGGRARLVRHEAQRWGELVAELHEYIRKQDYRFQDEPQGHEQTSPVRAVEQMAGQKSLR